MHASTSAAATPGNGDNAVRKFNIFQPFSDPLANSKMLALAIGQMLCTVATFIHDSYLPVYLQDHLGLSNTKIGAIQGAAQFLCQLSKGVSGVVGDILGSQVRVLVFGTFLTFLCKPMFAGLSTVYGIFGATVTVYWFFFAKLSDRLSKGIREAPTKAVMNELARESGDSPDAAYGLRQSLATAGALMGASIATLVFTLSGQNFVLTFSLAAIPPAIALLWLSNRFHDELWGKRQPKAEPTPPLEVVKVDGTTPPPSQPTEAPKPPAPKVGMLKKLQILVGAFRPVYWQALLVVAVLYFARFDASFLTLRAKQVMPVAAIPMLFFISSLMQTFLTAPLGKLAGTCVKTRNRLLMVGFVVMIMADAVFALPQFASTAGMFLGAGLLGLHMAMTHSITVSMVASYMPTGEIEGIGKLSGTAVSFTDLLLGFVLAASNGVAGVLSDYTRHHGLGNVGCFAGGATAAGLALLLLLVFHKFGDLGREDLIKRKKKPAAPPPAAA